jgi:hypothetical protein
MMNRIWMVQRNERREAGCKKAAHLRENHWKAGGHKFCLVRRWKAWRRKVSQVESLKVVRRKAWGQKACLVCRLRAWHRKVYQVFRRRVGKACGSRKRNFF